MLFPKFATPTYHPSLSTVGKLFTDFGFLAPAAVSSIERSEMEDSSPYIMLGPISSSEDDVVDLELTEPGSCDLLPSYKLTDGAPSVRRDSNEVSNPDIHVYEQEAGISDTGISLEANPYCVNEDLDHEGVGCEAGNQYEHGAPTQPSPITIIAPLPKSTRPIIAPLPKPTSSGKSGRTGKVSAESILDLVDAGDSYGIVAKKLDVTVDRVKDAVKRRRARQKQLELEAKAKAYQQECQRIDSAEDYDLFNPTPLPEAPDDVAAYIAKREAIYAGRVDRAMQQLKRLGTDPTRYYDDFNKRDCAKQKMVAYAEVMVPAKPDKQ
jgi:hypothetical protein